MKSERNYLVIISTFFTLITIIFSLFDRRWFWLTGGICNRTYIGLNIFFSIGKLYVNRQVVPWDLSAPLNDIYRFQANDYINLMGCVDTHSILIFRLIITLIFLVIISLLISLFIEIFLLLKCMRRYAFWQILSVILCTLTIGCCFYVSELIYNIQDKTRTKFGKKIEVQFGFAYYCLVISNGCLILSIALNLLRKTSTVEEENFERLIDDWSQREQTLFIERSRPATHDPPPDYRSDDDFLIV